jgi:hypothetical protein
VALLFAGAPTELIPDGDKVHDRIAFPPGTNPNTWGGLEAQAIVLHWTGGENGAGVDPGEYGVVDTLAKRRLSVHFIIEPDGRIVQTADLTTRCAHAGTPANDRAIGIEIASRGFATRDDLRGLGLRERTALDWEASRDVYTDTIHGERTHMVAFTPTQVQSMLWLVETLCGLLAIPRRVPHGPLMASTRPLARSLMVQHEGAPVVPAFDRDPRKWADAARARRFQGVLGHFHIHASKWDPGTQPFYALWAEGFNPAAQKFPEAFPL